MAADIKKTVTNNASELQTKYDSLYKTEKDASGREVQTEESIKNQNEFMAAKSKELNMSFSEIKELKSKVENGLPVDDILKDITVKSLPIWLKEQEDHTIIAKGFNALDKYVPIYDRENGSITFDYQTTTKADGKHPYYGSQKGQADKLVSLWQDNPREVDVETYVANLDYHKTVVTFKPLYTASHKSIYLFMAQLNDIQKQLQEPYLAFMLAYKAKIMWLGTQAEEGIISTDDGIEIKPQAIPTPDIEIKAKNLYELWSTFGNKMVEMFTPSRSFFANFGSESRQKEFILENIPSGLIRSMDPTITKIIAPSQLKRALSFGMRAGAFNEVMTLLNDKGSDFESMFDFIPYTPFTSEEYGSLTGIKNDMKVLDKDQATGSADILVYVPGTYQGIRQYQGTDTMAPGNNTIAFNYWEKLGFAMRKYENDLVLIIRLTLDPTTEPGTFNNDSNSKLITMTEEDFKNKINEAIEAKLKDKNQNQSSVENVSNKKPEEAKKDKK